MKVISVNTDKELPASIAKVSRNTSANDSLTTPKQLGKNWDSVDVVPITVEVQKGQDTAVPIVGTGGGSSALSYGTINIPKDTFPKGWTVEITPVSNVGSISLSVL